MKRLLMCVAFLGFTCIAGATEKVANTYKIFGFRELKWGMSTVDANKIYSDLVIGWKSTQGIVIYNRTSEDFRIGDTVFDEIRYGFKDDKFTKVIAMLELNWDSGKSLDAKDYVEKAPVVNFNKLKDMIESKYGQATLYKEETDKKKSGVDPLFLSRKKAEWFFGKERIIIDLLSGSTNTFLDKNKDKKDKKDMKDILMFTIEHIPVDKLGF